MSHACSHPRGLVRGRLRRLVSAATLLTAAFAVAAPAAHATPATLSFTDPAGDEVNGNPAVDLLSGSTVYDSDAGTVVIKLVASAPLGDTEGGFVVLLGQKSGNDCDSTTLTDGTNIAFLFAKVPGRNAASWLPIGENDSGGPYDATYDQTGGTVTMTTVEPRDLLKNKPWTCMQVQTIQSGTENAVDAAIGFLTTTASPGTGTTGGTASGSGSGSGSGTSSTKSTTTVLPRTAPVTTTAVDRDRDGVADASDRCPTVPGAQANGCPTMPPALEIRLGAKRIAIDKLVARTAATCPAIVRVKVSSKGKRVGSGRVSTSQFGGYCRVYGAVAIKIKKKVKAVRVTMTSAGLAGIAKSARR